MHHHPAKKPLGRGRAVAALALASGTLAFSVLSCSEGGAATSSGAGITGSGTTSAIAATTASATASPAKAADDVKPVYPVDGSPADPLAQKFCEAIDDIEPRRHGECCGAPGDKGYFTGECTRTLSAALRSKAVSLDVADVDRCAEAISHDLEGCGWVGPSAPPLPAVCDGIIHGQIGDAAVCRSSLECKDGLTCQGLTATRTGKCAPPKPAGVVCGGTVDTLAALTRQNGTEKAHPDCAGYCARVACQDAVAIGGACSGGEECGPKARCLGGKCSLDPYPGVGQPCAAGRCGTGARCVKEKCVAPKNEGDACESDLECRGACEKADGASTGKCGKRCAVLKIPTKPAFSVKSPAPSAAPKR